MSYNLFTQWNFGCIIHARRLSAVWLITCNFGAFAILEYRLSFPLSRNINFMKFLFKSKLYSYLITCVYICTCMYAHICMCVIYEGNIHSKTPDMPLWTNHEVKVSYWSWWQVSPSYPVSFNQHTELHTCSWPWPALYVLPWVKSSRLHAWAGITLTCWFISPVPNYSFLSLNINHDLWSNGDLFLESTGSTLSLGAFCPCSSIIITEAFPSLGTLNTMIQKSETLNYSFPY